MNFCYKNPRAAVFFTRCSTSARGPAESAAHRPPSQDRAYRQVWRFDFEGQGYYLKFYPGVGL